MNVRLNLDINFSPVVIGFHKTAYLWVRIETTDILLSKCPILGPF